MFSEPDARNPMVAATSSGLPARPRGWSTLQCSRYRSTSLLSTPPLVKNSVRITPGLTALTRTPKGAT